MKQLLALRNTPKNLVPARVNVENHGQVERVIIRKDQAKLVPLQKKLQKAVAAREVAEWAREKKLQGDNPQHRPGVCGCCMCWKPAVDSIEYWAGQQKEMEEAIASQAESAAQCPSAIVLFTPKNLVSARVNV